MIYYLAKSKYIKYFFILSNIILIVSVYLTNLFFLLKIIIIILVLYLNHKAFVANNGIMAFYLSTVGNSILLTNNNIEIKANYLKISYFSSILVVVCFKRGTKIFRILVFKDSVSIEQFKRLQILSRVTN